MSNLKAAILVSMCLLNILLQETALARRTGPGDGGGGELVKGEFGVLAIEVCALLKKSGKNEPPAPLLSGFSVENFCEKVRTADVEVVPGRPLLNGKPKDAINYPSANFIEVGSDSWTEYKSRFARLVLVTHEYLGLMKLPDPGYSHSYQVLLAAGVPMLEKIRVSDEKGAELADFVQANQTPVLRSARKALGHLPILEWPTIRCLAWTQKSGTCLVKGYYNAPNSDTVFAIVVSKPNFGSGDAPTIRFAVSEIDGES